jgi:uncharacterized protein YbaP (TraB family)
MITVSTVIIPFFICLAYFFTRIAQDYSYRFANLIDIGTVYEITNQLGGKSYLIGSIHMTDEEMIKKS